MFQSPRVDTCPNCGNNPVPHFLYWYFESLNILFAPIRRILLNNFLSRLYKNLANKINLPWRLIKLGIVFGIISTRPEIEKCGVKRARVLWEEGVKRGIVMKELLLFGKPFDVYLAEKFEKNQKSIHSTGLRQAIPNQKLVFSGLPRPKNYDDSSLEWMDDKGLFKEKMTRHGLPVPQGGVAWNFRQAREIFNEIQATRYSLLATRLSVIVKPRAGSRGRHSTTQVSSIEDLKSAFNIAKQLCFWVIVEEQLAGPVYRATLINYKLCGVLRGDPPQIIGDGKHAIAELIKLKNTNKPEGVRDIIIDDNIERFVARQIPNSTFQINSQFPKSALNYIPAPDSNILLSEKIGVNYGGSSSEDFEICHKDNKELFVDAAKTVGDPIVGFDFIISDITKSWKEQQCGFIEANSLPFINLHHDPLLGKPRNVAAKVWELVGM